MTELNPAQTITIWTALIGTIGTVSAWSLSQKLPEETKIDVSKLVIAGAIVVVGAGIASAYILKQQR